MVSSYDINNVCHALHSDRPKLIHTDRVFEFMFGQLFHPSQYHRCLWDTESPAKMFNQSCIQFKSLFSLSLRKCDKTQALRLHAVVSKKKEKKKRTVHTIYQKQCVRFLRLSVICHCGLHNYSFPLKTHPLCCPPPFPQSLLAKHINIHRFIEMMYKYSFLKLFHWMNYRWGDVFEELTHEQRSLNVTMGRK